MTAPSSRSESAVDRKPVVVLIGPFAPDALGKNLGLEQKLTLIIATLRDLAYDVHLVDSSHARNGWARAEYGRPASVGGQAITLWRPARWPVRPLGKLANLVTARQFVPHLLKLKPALVWMYNPYAFEARLGMALADASGSRLLLELEDLPRARSRGLNPKPWIDHAYFLKLLSRVTHITYVNSALERQYRAPNARSMLLPSMVEQALCEPRSARRFETRPYRLGYFGGLQSEKGCDVLLEVAQRLPNHWTLVVTGTGPLESAFRSLAARSPQRLEFHGRVARAELSSLMLGCDAIVNPHRPIADLQDGVFPFKVFESLATGALLITTDLPDSGVLIDDAAIHYDGSADALLDAIEKAPAVYERDPAKRSAVRTAVIERFGPAGVRARLKVLLDA